MLVGVGMGLAGAPATESIMSSLPPARANVGSAVNDTTRELGVPPRPIVVLLTQDSLPTDESSPAAAVARSG